jgi:hypothetical protein
MAEKERGARVLRAPQEQCLSFTGVQLKTLFRHVPNRSIVQAPPVPRIRRGARGLRSDGVGGGFRR